MPKSSLVEASDNGQAANIKWSTVIFMVIFHVGAVAALFYWSWPAFIIALILYWVAGSLGVGMGWHRLLTHRGFKVPRAVEYFLTLCGTLSLEGTPIKWVVTHRIHHAYTDRKGDPHTPRDGGWWAHMGWIFTGTGQQFPEEVRQRFAPDMMKDRVHVFIDRFCYVPLIVLGIALLWFGGLSVMLWGIFFRVTFNLHATWLVNSATHMWGKRRFETNDDSTNSWWVALLTFGEGWHNNHHAHPTSARHGLAWYEIDFNWWGIRTLQFLGLADSIKYVRLNGASAERQPASNRMRPEDNYEGI